MVRPKAKSGHIGPLFLGVIPILALTVAACGSATNGAGSAGSKAPLTALYIGDFSGPTKTLGGPEYASFYAGAAYVNAHGGVLGHKLTVVKLNDNGDGTTAVSALLGYLSSHPKPAMTQIGSEGGEVAALIPVLKREGLLGFAGTDNNVCLSNASNTCPTFFTPFDENPIPQGTAAAFFKSKGYTHVGILEEADVYNEGETPYFVKAAKADGMTTTVVSIPDDALDATPEVSKLKANGVQAVYVEAISSMPGYAAKARALLGWKVPFMFDPAAGTFGVTSLAPTADFANTFVVIARAEDAALHLPGVEVMRRYGDRLGLNDGVGYNASGAPFEFALLFASAAAQANSVEPMAVANALEHLSAKAESNPLYVDSAKVGFNKNTHENVLGSPTSDFLVVPTSPLVDGQFSG